MAAVYVSRCTDAALNIALETWLHTRGPSSHALMLWRNAPCVVLGRHQDARLEVEVARAAAESVPIFRRFSGGGTVVHDLGCLLYSVVTPASAFCRRTHVAMAARAMDRAVDSLGRPLACERLRVTERCDIVLEGSGLKVGGSAFRIASGRALHHGTLLLASDVGRISRLLCLAPSDPGVADAASPQCIADQDLPSSSDRTTAGSANAQRSTALGDRDDTVTQYVRSVKASVANVLPGTDADDAFDIAVAAIAHEYACMHATTSSPGTDGSLIKATERIEPTVLYEQDILNLDPVIAAHALKVRTLT